MAKRRAITEEEKRRKELIKELLKTTPLRDGQDLNDIMKEFIAEMVNGSLEGELDDELGYNRYDVGSKETSNSRNGFGNKTMQTSYGEVDIKVPRDRQGDYEPRLIGKHKTMLNDEVERKIISMYAKGMTTGAMEAHIRDLYGLDISDSTISRITDKVLPIAKEWQARPLESIYAVVYMDAIHYHVRQDGRIVKKAVYIAIGINLDGIKDVLGLWVGENESSKYWLSVINEIKNRGVQDVLIACFDGLSGFSEAISAVFPDTEIQKCVIHQIRNSTRFVSYKDIKSLMADLKRVYTAPTEETAVCELEKFHVAWGKKYPKITISWRKNWA